jgi:two-component system NarL family response regulator
VIRILIVDDHPAVRIGLASMLQAQAELEIIGAAASGQEALGILDREVPDVLLVDIRMQLMNGFELLHEVQRRHLHLRSIVLTSYETDEDVFMAVNAGAQGYLLKDSSEQELLQAIFAVHAGKSYFPQHIARRLADRMRRSALSARELDVLQMMAKGFTNKQIATGLGISSHTVRCHVANITAKLEVGDRTEAVTIAFQYGVLHLDS